MTDYTHIGGHRITPQSSTDTPAYVCVDCKQTANSLDTYTDDTCTPARSEPADFGGGESTGVQEL